MDAESTRPEVGWPDCALIGSLIGLLLAAAWWGWGRANLSLDEGYSRMETGLKFSTLLDLQMRRELNGSLHTLALSALRMAGGSTVWLRLPSTVFFAGAVALLYLAFLRFGRTAAVIGAGLVAVNPLLLQDAVVARCYALALLFIAASLFLLERSWRRGGGWKLAVAYGLVCGLGIYAHFFVIAYVVSGLLFLVMQRRQGWPNWSATLGIIGILLVPLIVFIATGGTGRGQLGPMRMEPPAAYVSRVLTVIAPGAASDRILEGVIVLGWVAVLALPWLIRRPRAVDPWWALGIGGAALIVIVALIGSRLQPGLFQARYLALGLPFLGLAVAASARSHHERWARLALAAVLCGSSISVIITAGDRTPAVMRPWSSAVAAIERHIAAGVHVVTMAPYEAAVARYYVAGGRPVRLTLSPGVPASTGAVLKESPYAVVHCFPARTDWVLDTISQHLHRDATRAAACVGEHIAATMRFGHVTLLELAGNAPTRPGAVGSQAR